MADETNTHARRYLASLLLFGTNGIVASQIALASSSVVLLRTFFGALLLSVLLVVVRRRQARAALKRCRSVGTRAVVGATARALLRLSRLRDVLLIALSGVAMGISWLFQYEAYWEIGVGLTSVIYCVGPVAVMALAPLLLKERVSPSKVAGLAVVLVGVALVNVQGVLGATMSLRGIACAVMTAVAYAAMVLLNKQARGLESLVHSAVQLIAAFAVAFAFVMATQGELPAPSAADWPFVLVLGLLNTGFGCYLYFPAINVLPAHMVAVCDYIEPIMGIVLAAVVLGEALAPLQMAGAALVLAGAIGPYVVSSLAARKGARSPEELFSQ